AACAAFTPGWQTAPEIQLKHFLETQGLSYSAQRWQAHANDLARAAGTCWGLEQGRRWEMDIRAGLTARYGPTFFRPERWLVATMQDGSQRFRQLDGLEKRSATC